MKKYSIELLIEILKGIKYHKMKNINIFLFLFSIIGESCNTSDKSITQECIVKTKQQQSLEGLIVYQKPDGGSLYYVNFFPICEKFDNSIDSLLFKDLGKGFQLIFSSNKEKSIIDSVARVYFIDNIPSDYREEDKIVRVAKVVMNFSIGTPKLDEPQMFKLNYPLKQGRLVKGDIYFYNETRVFSVLGIL